MKENERVSLRRWTTMLLLALSAMVASCQLGQEDERTGAWKHVPADTPHTDHSTFFNAPFADGPAVTRACLKCHQDAAAEVMKTPHWTWLGEEVVVPGHREPTRLGKKNVINNFCIGVTSNWPACTSCHAGYGWEDASFDFSAQDHVDCLVCHDHSGTYVKKAKGAGWPAPDVDLLTVARSVGRPTRANCGACHFRGGGGNAVKHGDLDDTLLNPVERIDVHMGRNRFECVDCHQTESHAIPGRSISVSVQDTNRVRCSDCHQGPVHSDARLNKHTERVACQTCHIPRMAVEEPTKMTWKWSEAGQDLDIQDKHVYMKIKGRFTYQKGGQPEYAWYNGTSSRYLLGDEIDPEKPTKIAFPLGERKDPKARIWPFKVHRGDQPYDKKNKTFLVPNVFGKEGYWSIFDWQKALKNGAAATGQEYSGEFGFAPTEMYWPLSHMVAPRDEALSCRDCHGEKGRLDWKALGYDGDPLAREPFEHEEIVLMDADGQAVVDSGKPVSLSATCGECHDAQDEDFLTAHAYHRNLDRKTLPAERQALLENGPVVAEGERSNCLLCHLAGASQAERMRAIAAGRGDWSQTATLAATGAVERTADGWAYKKEAFGEEKAISLPLGRPSENNCGACHGLVHEGHAPLQVELGSAKNWVTEKSGQVFSGQRIRLSALNLKDKDRLRQPWDVHAERLVTCVDCHYAAGLPARFEKEGVTPAAKADGQRRRCETCHSLAGSHSWLPKPETHFSALSCEACHVPRLHMAARQVEDRTVLKADGGIGLTYRGLAGGLVDGKHAPYILGYEPVLLPRGDGGPLSPFNLITTFYWVSGDEGTPVPAEKLRRAWLTDGALRPELVAALDGNGDGRVQPEELRLDTEAKVALIARALSEQGVAQPRIEGWVRSEAIHHDMSNGPFARRECLDCHEHKGQKQLRLRPAVELAPYRPAGVTPKLRADEGLTRPSGRIVVDPKGGLIFAPGPVQPAGQASGS